MIPTYNLRANVADGLARLGFLVAAAFLAGNSGIWMKLPLTTDVREGPKIGTTNLHFDELMIYTFNKPENRGTSLVRNQQMELQKFDQAI